MTGFKWAVKSAAIVLAGSIVAGCATGPIDGNNDQAASGDGQDRYREKVAQEVQRDPLFILLTAELANQRGDTYSATLAYTEAAKALKDPELAKRAVELGLGDGQLEMAFQAAKVWKELAPEDRQVSRTFMVLQLGTNRVDDALPALKKYLDDTRAAEQAHPGVAGATPEKVALEMLMRIPDKNKAYSTAIELFGNNSDDVEAQALLAQVANSSEKFELAVAHLQNVINKVPQERYYVLQAQFMERRDNNMTAAMQLVTEKADQNPNWFGARLYLARNHTQLEQWEQAKQRFTEMLALQPENTPLYSSLGFVLSKTGDRKAAEQNFRKYLERTPLVDRQNETLIHLTMADMAINDKDFAAAHNILDKATNSKTDFDIQLKKSAVYEKQGKLQEASLVLEQFKALDEDTAVRLALAKSQQAESRKTPEAAVQALEQGLLKYPNQPDLLYERAMVAERQNDLGNVETNLRKLIEVRPDNAHGYNALGYTWADRNIRLQEALTLITKANELAPRDPFIMDSLGWVYYRLGELDKAEDILKKAYGLRPDEEIGLHLIEVLKQKGRKDEARQLGETLKTQYPNSQKLQKLMQELEGV